MSDVNRILSRTAIWIALAGFCFTTSRAQADSNEFFEQRIRPLLVEQCYKCHSAEAEKIKGGLRVDTRDALLKGGDTGPAIIPGDPDRSLLIKAVRYADEDLQMPPKNKKLSDQQIADLEAWVKMGAPDPRTEKSLATAKPNAAREHWAFQPVKSVAPPEVKNRSWVKTPIDNFILAKLETNHIKPATPADKHTLLRRATFDLIGLPPTMAEMENFLQDTSPDAFAKVVERLLASPRYGERWGRHWLDVARYADTKGYVYADREEKRFVHSSTYRDWVIQSFNKDLPYDRFLKLQIAADLMPDADRDSLAAMGFLTLGRRFLGVTHDIIDDRIDVLTRGTLGLTVSCARCHDHKFDPIPTADYYSLYGVFAGTTERMVSLNGTTPNAKEYLDFETELRRREDAFRSRFNQKREEQSARIRGKVADYLTAVLDVDKIPTEEFYSFVAADDINPVVVRRWHSYLMETEKAFHPVWAPWHAYAKIPTSEFTNQSAKVIGSFTKSSETLNPLVAAAFKENAPSSMKEVAAVYGELFSKINIKAKAAETKLNKNEEALREILYAADSPSVVPPGSIADMEWYLDEPTRVQLGRLSRQVEAWIVESPGAPPHAMILEDRPVQKNPRVFRRGNPANLGEEIPRRFLEVLSGPERAAFAKGSGRLELANAIADKENPLTARVMVNRVWQHHFGAGLVRTPSDFGTRCEPPSHPELLDWLAREFMEHGWSVKKLHRQIMLSATYQQSSETPEPEPARVVLGSHADETNSVSAANDPENKLLAHFNRQRLDFEALRDSLLFTSGELDLQMGGKSQELFAPKFSKRRAVYGYFDRQFLPGTLRVFDFANPDMHSPARSETTVPQQALFFLNGPFVIERAKELTARVAKTESPDKKIDDLYQLVFQRHPTPPQLRMGLQFIKSAEAAQIVEAEMKSVPSAWTYGFGAFDEKKKTLGPFTELPHFNGEAWQGGAAWPDKKLGWLQLTPTGGHAGDNLKHAVVRRWTSPVSGEVSIEGEVKHEHELGHGIRAYLYSSREGLLTNWVLHNQSVESKVEHLKVEPGETVDFIVSIHESLNNNDFLWAPVIRMTGPNAIRDGNGYAKEWNAKRDFGGPPDKMSPPLTPWEKYAQALLSANEFLFVD